jgi:hypothetical protein
MKRMTGYYVPSSMSDARSLDAQFRRKEHLKGPPRMPSTVAGGAWQEILRHRRSYPCDLWIIKNGLVVSHRLIQSRDDLAACSGWYWEHSQHMTLEVRFTPDKYPSRTSTSCADSLGGIVGSS